MADLKKLFKDSSRVLNDSGITTCYSTPQARKNRIPSYFEQLEPRQLLSGTQVDPESYAPSAPVVAEPFATTQSNPLDNIADLQALIDQATSSGFSEDDFANLLQQIPGLEGLIDATSNLIDIGEQVKDVFSNIDYFLGDGSITGNKDLGTGSAAWFSLWGSLTVSGNFFSNDDYDKNNVLIVASGDVILENLTFKGIENITIRAQSVTIDGGQTITIEGGEMVISALDYIKLSNGGAFKAEASGDDASKLTMVSSHSIVVDGGSIKDFGDVTMNAATISLTNTTVTINGDFSATATTESFIHPLLGPLPFKMAQGSTSITITDSTITANSVTISASTQTTMEKSLPSLAEVTGNQYLGFLDNFLSSSLLDVFKEHLNIDVAQVDGALKFLPDGLGDQASEYLQKISTPLSDFLNELYGSLEISAPVLVTYGSAESIVTVASSTITSNGGDVSITAHSSITNEQSKDADLFGFVLSINQSNARVLINDGTTIVAQQNAIIGATSLNENSVTLNVVYNAESDPAAKPPLFSQGSGQQGAGQQGGGATTQRKKNTYALGVALGINETQASVMLGENVRVQAGSDIVITSDVTEVLALTADANATSAGNLAIGAALNFGKAKSKTEVLGSLTADGSVKVTSEVDSKVTTSSNTNLPSAGGAADTTPAEEEQEQGDPSLSDKITKISEGISSKLTDLILSIIPMGYATNKLQESKMGLGVALGFAMHDASADTIIGNNAVITALGNVPSLVVTEGLGAVVLKATSNTTPIITVSATANLDPASQSATKPPTDSTTNPPGEGEEQTPSTPGATATVDEVKAVGVITSKEEHGFNEGDRVIYNCSDPTKAIPGLKNGETYVVHIYKDNPKQFALRSADGSTIIHFSGANSQGESSGWKDATHTFEVAEASTPESTGVVSVSQDAATVKGKNIANGGINCDGHLFKVGDVVLYTSANPANGLAHNQKYTIFEVKGNSFTLADSQGNKITIRSAGAQSEHTFTRYVEPTSSGAVTVKKDNVASGQVNAQHTFKVGDILSYSASDTADALGGLTSGQKYTVAAVGAGYFTLKGADGKVISITQNSKAATEHTFTKAAPETTGAKVVVPGSKVQNSQLSASNIPFKDGDKVTYDVVGAGTALDGLIKGQEYTIKNVNLAAGTFQLADANGALITLSAKGAAQSSDHVFSLNAAKPLQKDKGVSIAAGVTIFTNEANVVVKSGSKIVYNTLVDIHSDANYKTPKNTPTPLKYIDKAKSITGKISQVPIGFVQDIGGSLNSIVESIDSMYLDAQHDLGEVLFGVDAINFGNSGSNFFVPNSYIYAVTSGAKESSTAASISYIGQENTSTATVEDNVSIVRTGDVTNGAINAADDTIQLADTYRGHSGYVIYEVEGTAINGLEAGKTYWGVVDEGTGKLKLYTNKDSLGTAIDIDVSASALDQHYFLFEQQPTSEAGDSEVTVGDPQYDAGDAILLTLKDTHGFSNGDIVTVSEGLGLDTDSLYMVFVQSDTQISLKKIGEDGTLGDSFEKITLSEADSYSIVLATDDQKESANIAFDMTTDAYKKGNTVSHNPLSIFGNVGKIDVTYTAQNGHVLGGLSNGGKYTLWQMGGGSFILTDQNGDSVAFSLQTDEQTADIHVFTAAGGTSLQVNGKELVVKSMDVKGQPVSVASVTLKGETITSSDEAAQALRTGDVITYTSSDPQQVIPGLEHGKEYVVTVLDNGSFALRAYANGKATGDFISLDRACKGVDKDVIHTFSLTKPASHAPLEVSTDNQVSGEGAIFIGNHDFQTGDRVELAGLATDATGAVILNADGTPQYTSVGVFTVVRLSDTSVKLIDAKGNSYAVPAGVSSGLEDFRLTRVNSGSPVVTHPENGSLRVLENTFKEGDKVIYRAGDGASTSGLVSGQEYFIASLVVNNDGTSTITLSKQKGGAAMSVTLDEGSLHMLSLAENRVYGGEASDGGVKISDTTGLYDGAEFIFNGSGLIDFGEGKNQPLVNGTNLFAKLGADGVVRFALSQEDYLSGSFVNIVEFDGTLQAVGEVHNFNQNTVDLGAYIITSEQPHGLVDGSVVTIEGDDGSVEFYFVTTYGDYNFTLTEVETELIASRDFIFSKGDSVSLNRALQSITFTGDDVFEQPLFISQDNHGFVDGQTLQYISKQKDEDGNTTEEIVAVYYVVLRDANSYYLADTLEDAMSGNVKRQALPVDTKNVEGENPKEYSLRKLDQEHGIFVRATSSDKTVNLTGKMGTGKGAIKSTTAATKKQSAISLAGISKAIKNKISPERNPNSGSGVGAAIQLLNLHHTTTSLLGTSDNSATTFILGPSLSVTANADNGIVSMVQAGSSGELKGLSGTMGLLYMDNTTTAQLGVGSGRVTLGNALGADGKNSLFIEAKDKSIYTQLSATMTTGQSAAGGTVFVQVANRDTNAYLQGNAHLGGKVTVLGTAEVNALNTGRGVAILIGGSHASPAQQQEATTTENKDQQQDGQTGGQAGGQTGSSKQSTMTGIASLGSSINSINDVLGSLLPKDGLNDDKLTDEQKKELENQEKDGNLLGRLTGDPSKSSKIFDNMKSGFGDVDKNTGSMTQGTPTEGSTEPGQEEKKQDEAPKASTAYTGEIFVGYSSDETRAVVENLQSLVVAGFVARALNDTKQITAAGAFALTTKGSEGQGSGGTGASGAGASGGGQGTDATAGNKEGSPDSKAGAGSLVVAISDRDTEAYLDNVTLTTRSTGDVSVSAKDDGFAITVAAGLAGSTSGSGYGGSILVNTRLSDVKSYITNSDVTVNQGTLSVDAVQDVKMITVAGGGGFGDAKGVGLSLGVNVLIGDTVAYISSDASHTTTIDAKNIQVTATSGTGTGREGIELGENPEENLSGIDSVDGGYNLIAIGASAGIAKGGNSLGGALVANIVVSKTDAYLENATLTADESVTVLAADKFGILSIGGSLGLSGKAKQKEDAENTDAQKSTSVGAVLAVNVIHSTSNAYGKNITIKPRNISSAEPNVSIVSLSKQQILAIAGAAAAAKGDAIAVALGVNVIAAGASARLEDTTITGKFLAVKAGNESSILSIAGGVGLSTGNNKAAAIAANVIAGVTVPALGPDSDPGSFKSDEGKKGNLDVTARVVNSTINLSGDTDECMVVLAETSSAILSIAAGIGVSTSSEEGSTDKSNLAGSATVNVISRDVTASVENSNITTAGKVSIISRDYIISDGVQKGSRILAIAGQIGASKSSQIGAALGVNVIANNVTAEFIDSDMTQTGTNGGLDILADSIGEILSVTGSVAVSINSDAGAKAKSASIAVNVIDKDVTARISDANEMGVKDIKGPIEVRATDLSQILSIAGAVAVAVGADPSAIGGTVAVNVVTSRQNAFVTNANITADGVIKIGATGQNSIQAINIGVAGSGLVANPNIIVNETNVAIVNSSLTATKDIDVGAWQLALGDNASISEVWSKKFIEQDSETAEYLELGDVDFNTNILSVNLNIAGGINASNSSIGGAVAVNVITSKAQVVLDNSSLQTTDKSINITSVNSAVIRAVAVGAAVSINGQSAMSGGLASNTVTGGAFSKIINSSLHATENISVGALNNADIFSLAVNAAVSTSASGLGLFVNVNVINVDTKAIISGNEGSSMHLSTGADLELIAKDTSKIWGITVAAAVGKGTAASVANNTSVIAGTVEASITGVSELDVGGTLSVAALSSTQIVNIAVGAAVGMGSGVAAQATLSENVITRTVNATIADVTSMIVGGNLVVNALEAQPSAIGNWREKAYMKGTGIGDVNTDDFAGASENDSGVSVGGSGGHSVDPNDALFNPNSGIFSLVVSVAASAGSGAAVSGALTFNWLEREVNATVTNSTVKMTGKGFVTVTAQSAAAAFGGVLSVGASASGAAVGAAVAVNVLDNKTRAILDNCTIGGWHNNDWDVSNLEDVTVRAENTSGAVGMVVGVGASGGVGVGASVALNLGMSAGKTAPKTKDDVNSLANGYYEDLLENGSSSYTTDSSELGGESAEAQLNKVVLHSSGSLVVEAVQNSALMSVNLSVGAASQVGVAGAIALNLLSINSAASVMDSVITTGTAKVRAESAGKAWAFLVGVGAAGSVGVTGLVSLSRVGGTAQAYVTGGKLTTISGGLNVSAFASTDMLTVGVGVAAAGNVAASGSVVMAFAGNSVNAKVEGTVLNLNRDLQVAAENTTSVITTSLGVAGSGGVAGTGGIALNLSTWGEAADYDPTNRNRNAKATDSSDKALEYLGAKQPSGAFATTVFVDSDKITAKDITLSAQNASSYVAGLILVAGSGNAAGAGGLVFNLMDSTSSAILNVRGAIAASGKVEVKSSNTTKLWATMASAAGSGAVAGAGSVALNLSDISSEALINGIGDSKVEAQSIAVTSVTKADLYALALSIAGSGAAAGAVSVALNASTNPSEAAIMGDNQQFVLSISNSGAVTVESDNKSNLVAGTLGVAGAGTAAGGASISINVASKGELGTIARNIQESESGRNLLKTADGNTIAEHTAFKGTIIGDTLYLYDSKDVFQSLNTSGVTNDTHYLMLTTEDGEEKLYSFTRGAVNEDGSINLSMLVGVDDNSPLTAIPHNASLSYRSNKYGAPLYTSDTVDEVASSTAVVRGVEVKGQNVNLNVHAMSERETLAVASGLAGAGIGAGYGSVNVSVSNNLTQAIVENSQLTLGTGNLSIKADNTGKSFDVGVALAGGAYGAGSAVVTVSVDSGETNAVLKNTQVNSVQDVEVNATTTLTAFNVNVAAAGAMGAGAATVATTVISGGTLANISGGSIKATGAVNVLATFGESGSLVNLATLGGNKSELDDILGEAGTLYTAAEDNANKSGNDQSNDYDEETGRGVQDSLSAKGILSVAVTAAGGGGAIAGATAVNKITGNVQSLIENVTLIADSFRAQSFMKSSVQSYVASAAFGGLGLSGSVSINTLSGKTTSLVTGSSLDIQNSAAIVARQELFITGLTGVVGVGGVAGGFGLVLNTLSGDVSAQYEGAQNGTTSLTAGSLSISANRESTINAYALGVSLGMTGALSGGVVINTLSGSTVAALEGKGLDQEDVTVVGDITISALEKTVATSLGVQAAGGAGIAAAAGVAITNATGAVRAYAQNINFTKADTLTIQANSVVDLSIKGFGAAVGSAAVGAIVSDINLNSTIEAYIRDSVITEVKQVNVLGNGDWNLYSFSVAGAAGILAGAGTNSKVSLTSRVDAYIANTDIKEGVEQVTIKASGTPRVRAIAVTPTLSYLGGVGVALANASIAPVINAYASNIHVGVANETGPDFNISAVLNKPSVGYSAEAKGYALAAAGLISGAGVNTSVSNEAVVKAYAEGIKLNSRFKSLHIEAQNFASLNAYGTGVSLAGTAGIGVVTTSLNSKTQTYAFITSDENPNSRPSIVVSDALTVKAQSRLDTDHEVNSGAGALGVAGAAGIARQVVESTTATGLGYDVSDENAKASTGKLVVEAGSVNVQALNEFYLNQRAKASALALASGAGSDSYLEINADTKAVVGDSAIVTANNIAILSKNIILRGIDGHANGSDSTAIGAITGQAGGTNTVIVADSKVVVGKNASLLGVGRNAYLIDADTMSENQNIRIEAFNVVDVSDSLAFSSTALASVALVSGSMSATLNASVDILESAKITTNNPWGSDIIIHAGSQEVFSLDVGSSLSGAASAGALQALMKITSNNTVHVYGGVKIYSSGGMVLATGLINDKYLTHGASGIGSSDLSVYGNIYDNTVAPMSVIQDSGLSWRQLNQITVDESGILQSRGDTDLYAQKGSSRYDSVATAHNWVAGVLGKKDYSGKETEWENNVVVDGSVTAGVDNVIEAEIKQLTSREDWEKVQQSEDVSIAEKNRIAKALRDFEAYFGVDYFVYLEDPQKASLEFTERGLTAAQAMDDEEWTVFLDSLGEWGVSGLVKDVFKELCNSTVSQLQNLTITQEGLTELLENLSIDKLEMAYIEMFKETLWQSLLDRNVEITEQKKYFEDLAEAGYSLKTLGEQGNVKAANYLSMLAEKYLDPAMSNQDMTEDDWKQLKDAHQVQGLSPEQIVAIELIISDYAGKLSTAKQATSDATATQAQYDALASIENAKNAAYFTNWETMLTERKAEQGFWSPTWDIAYEAFKDNGWNYAALSKDNKTAINSIFVKHVEDTWEADGYMLDVWKEQYTTDKITGTGGITLSTAITNLEKIDFSLIISEESIKALDAIQGNPSQFATSFWNLLVAQDADNKYFAETLLGVEAMDNGQPNIYLRIMQASHGYENLMPMFGSNILNQFYAMYVSQYSSIDISQDPQSVLENLEKNLGFYVQGKNTDLLSYELRPGEVNNSLVNEYLKLREIVLTYGDSDPAGQEASRQLGELEDKLVEAGLGTKNNSGQFLLQLGNATGDLWVGNAIIYKGNVTIIADNLAGMDNIHAEGSSSLDLVSAFPTLHVDNITISAKEGGQVRFFDNKGNTTVKYDEDGTPSSITIRHTNKYGMLVVGDLENLTGNITISSLGDLNVNGRVIAGTLNVSAIGRIVISLEDDIIHNVGGLPATITGTSKENIVNGPSNGGLLALGDIHISAGYINVNGLIQSGVKEYTVTISEGDKVGYLTINRDGTATVSKDGAGGLVMYTYDENSSTYLLEPISVGGGHIYITGIVMNTNAGFGKIAVYTNPDIKIVNNSTAGLHMAEITTGNSDSSGVYIRENGNEGTQWQQLTGGSYTPLTNTLKYNILAGSTSKLTSTYVYEKKILWGWDFLDWAYPDKESMDHVGTILSDNTPFGPTGGFMTDGFDMNSLVDQLLNQRIHWGDIHTASSQFPGTVANDIQGFFIQYKFDSGEPTTTNYAPVERYEGAFLARRKVITYRTDVSQGEQTVLWLQINTNNAIAIDSGQQGGGSVVITSAGPVELSGAINASGDITITVDQGDLTDSGQNWINSSGGTINITTANGSIGSENRRISLITSSEKTVSLTAAKSVFVQANGDMLVNAKAQKQVDLQVSGTLLGSINAPQVVLSAMGDIGSANNRLSLSNDNTAQGVLISATVTDSTGSIYLTSSTDMHIAQISGPDTVDIATNYSLYDANLADVVDQQDLDRLESMWKRLGILASDNQVEYETQLEERVALRCGQLISDYHNYHILLSAIDKAGGERAYAELLISDESYGFISRPVSELTEAEKAQALSEAMQWLRLRLESFSDSIVSFNPNLLKEPYNDSFSIDPNNLTAEQEKLITEQASSSLWTREMLSSKITEALFNGTTSTLYIEEANIVGRDIKLKAKAIGSRTEGVPFVIKDYQAKQQTPQSLNKEELFYLSYPGARQRYDEESGDMVIVLPTYVVEDYHEKITGEKEFSERDKFFLWTSEVTDRSYDEVSNSLSINLCNDLNIHQLAGGKLDIEAVEHALIGSGVKTINDIDRQDLVIGNAKVTGSGGELRLKADGNLYTIAGGIVEADYLVLEASNGDLGARDNYLMLGEHKHMQLRAYGNMYIGSDTDIHLDGISKEKDKEAYIRTTKNIIIKTDKAIVPDKSYFDAGENIIVTGHKLVDIAGSLKAGEDIDLEGPTIRIDASAIFQFDEMNIILADAGSEGTSSLVIGDATFVNALDPTAIPQISIIGQGTTNLIDASVSELDGLWEIGEVGGGSFERDGVVFSFSDIDAIHGSSADDTLNLQGGLMEYIDLGSGHNAVHNQTKQNAHWTVDGNGRILVSVGNLPLVGALNGASEIYGLANTLEYSDPSNIPGHWVVGQQRGNSGTINDLRFNNIMSTIHSSPGGTYDLYGRMDNIHLNTGPLTFIVYPGGFFYNLTFASNVSMLDLRPTHKYIPDETQVEAALRYFLPQDDILSKYRALHDGLPDYDPALGVRDVTTETAEVMEYETDMVASSSVELEEGIEEETPDEAVEGQEQTENDSGGEAGNDADAEVKKESELKETENNTPSDADSGEEGEQKES